MKKSKLFKSYWEKDILTGKELDKKIRKIEKRGFSRGEAEQILWKEIIRERGYPPTEFEVRDLMKTEKLRKVI
jgi:hypothetical protein